MAATRTEKSTIPADRDPLADVSFEQNKPKPPEEPIDGLIPKPTGKAPQEPQTEPQSTPKPLVEETPHQKTSKSKKTSKGKMTVLVENDLLERVRNAAWWERKTLATLAEDGLRIVVERLEKRHGGPFEQREKDLQTGRPQGSKNGTNKAR